MTTYAVLVPCTMTNQKQRISGHGYIAIAQWKLKVKRRKLRDGSYRISCPKGLWQVTCPNREDAEREGARYFIQYALDGEYND